MSDPQAKNPRRALVVLSGGQDSTTCLFWAKQHFDEVHAITFDYGQRHAREIQAAKDVAILAGVASHEVVALGPILQGTSPLTNAAEELETYPSFDEMAEVIGDRIEKTFVPMRNTLFLTIAANRAVVRGCGYLVTGVCQEDNANYPDCRADFIAALEVAFRESLGQPLNGQGLTILTPLMNLSKAESVGLALKTEGAFVALAFSHTAYDGSYPPIGSDHATLLRAEGFKRAQLPDPLVVRANMEGLMPLPETPNYEHADQWLPEARDAILSQQVILALHATKNSDISRQQTGEGA